MNTLDEITESFSRLPGLGKNQRLELQTIS